MPEAKLASTYAATFQCSESRLPCVYANLLSFLENLISKAMLNGSSHPEVFEQLRVFIQARSAVDVERLPGHQR